jgi:Ni,Fe-hydrogenase I large subunit
MADKIHSVMKTLRLTPQEAALLAEKSKSMEMNEASYLRLLISQQPDDYPEIREQIKQLINEVNHIGVNINQIVHHHNYELYSKEDREQLIAYMKKLNITLKEAVKSFGNQ